TQCQFPFREHLWFQFSKPHIRKCCLWIRKSYHITLFQFPSLDTSKLIPQKRGFTPHDQRNIQTSCKRQIPSASVCRSHAKSQHVSRMHQQCLIHRSRLPIQCRRQITASNGNDNIFFKPDRRSLERHLNGAFTHTVPHKNVCNIKGLCIHRPCRGNSKLLASEPAFVLYCSQNPRIF